MEDIDSIQTKELGIGPNIRERRVGINGTNQSYLYNEFQIS